MSSDALVALDHQAVVDGDLYAQYELAKLEREAEAEEAFWTEEYARRERDAWRYYDVVCMRRHLPSFNYRPRVGRERRAACNTRTRGSRRVTRAGSSSDDDPGGEGDKDAPDDDGVRESADGSAREAVLA